MKASFQSLTLAGLSLLLGLTASYPAQARNDTLRPVAKLRLQTERVNPAHPLTPEMPAYFWTNQLTPEVELDVPAVPDHFLPARRFLLGPAGMPVQDFVFTRFPLSKPAKER